MSDSWQTTPPAPCHRTGNDTPERGPYFVENFHYAEVTPGPTGPQVLPRVRPIVHSAGWIGRILDSPYSPYAKVTKDELAELQRALEDARAERDEMELRLAESQATVSTSPVDVEALASALIVPLGEHFARKSGPRPKAAA